MFQVVTVATKNFFPLTKRLLASLRNSGNDCHLTVFCDDVQAFHTLGRNKRCTVRELPEIKSLGVKRAKFEAYCRAFQEGSFLYLDSDILVLQPIQELTQHSRIAGCFDDLSCVHAIPDKRHPWPGDPALENRCFINSGVFFAPKSRREFFQELLSCSRSDELWERYILPGSLYDNLFLCAYFNLLNEPVEYVDAEVYNWPGFVVDGQLQVKRNGDSLVHCRSNKVLKVAHFAGVREPDRAMCTWPVEVVSLLSSMGGDGQESRETAFVNFLATLSDDFAQPTADPIPGQTFNYLAAEAVDLFTHNLQVDSRSRRSYLVNPAAMISLGYSVPLANHRWNGLACGHAYFEGEEYNFLQRIIQQLDIRTAVETGAGETSILLKRLGVDALSIESQEGPWLKRAREQGCRCRLIPFDPNGALFDRETLLQAVSEFAPSGKINLLLVDSPSGTQARSRIVEQVLPLAKPRYVLVHDALRDAGNVFECMQRFGMRLAAFLPSDRGAILLRARDEGETCPGLMDLDRGTEMQSPRIRIELLKLVENAPGDRWQGCMIRITNLGPQTLSSRYTNPVHCSYHWLSPDEQVLIWDGVRTPLPFDILPGGAADFEVNVLLPEGQFESVLCFALVQEKVGWFEQFSPENRLKIRVRGGEGSPLRIERSLAATAG